MKEGVASAVHQQLLLHVDCCVFLHRAGTHNGKFHCDEVLACYMLKLLPEYRDAEIVRTREPKVGAHCKTLLLGLMYVVGFTVKYCIGLIFASQVFCKWLFRMALEYV